jgi:putative acetyltransferase
MNIKIDDLSGPEIAALLEEHVRNLSAISPPESCHALDLNALRKPGITFWSAWEGNALCGCGALKELSAKHAEVKSMRTAAPFLRRGVASKMLAHIINVARERAYEKLSLETGPMVEFAPARAMYERLGFAICGPFGDYVDDPNSVFMELHLRGNAHA